MTCLVTSRIAVKFLGRVCGQRFSCEVSRRSLGTSRMAVESLGRALKLAG